MKFATTCLFFLVGAGPAFGQEQVPAPPPPPGYPPPGTAPPGYAPPPPGYYYGPPPAGYVPPVLTAPPPVPGYQKHDGFFLRLLLGPAATSVSADAGDGSLSISGGGFVFALGLGGALMPDLILYCDIALSSSSNPTVKSGRTSLVAKGTDLDFFHIGPAVAYYLTTNTYVAASIGISSIHLVDRDSGDTTKETGNGLGLSATVGHEFWVSTNWGLGIAGRVGAGRIKDKTLFNQSLAWRASSYSLLFSATFN